MDNNTEEQAIIEPEIQLSIEDFCSDLSLTCKRVELIGAFAHVEMTYGRQRDTESNYQARFEAFVGKPVGEA
ncbi:MAG: hypothetical protein ACMV0I_06760 [Pseudomonas sp.]